MACARSSYCDVGRSPPIIATLLLFFPFSRTQKFFFSLSTRAVPATRGTWTGLARHNWHDVHAVIITHYHTFERRIIICIKFHLTGNSRRTPVPDILIIPCRMITISSVVYTVTWPQATVNEYYAIRVNDKDENMMWGLFCSARV